MAQLTVRVGGARISIYGDDADFRAASRRVVQEIERQRRSMRRTTYQARALTGAYAKLRSHLYGIGAAYSAIRATGALIRMADEATQLGNRLRLVTEGARDLNARWEELLELANRTRVPLESSIALYQRMAIAIKSAGIGTSQPDLLRVTEAVNKAAVISGASIQATIAGMIQFSQGIASNRLAGDELRSVLENLPRLSIAIADGLGISVGALREWGREGKLTAETIVPALLSQIGKLDEEFAKINRTIGQAATQLRNSFLNVLTGADEEVAGLSDSIRELLDTMRELIESEGFKRALTDVISLLSHLTAGITHLLEFQARQEKNYGIRVQVPEEKAKPLYQATADRIAYLQKELAKVDKARQEDLRRGGGFAPFTFENTPLFSKTGAQRKELEGLLKLIAKLEPALWKATHEALALTRAMEHIAPADPFVEPPGHTALVEAARYYDVVKGQLNIEDFEREIKLREKMERDAGSRRLRRLVSEQKALAQAAREYRERDLENYEEWLARQEELADARTSIIAMAQEEAVEASDALAASWKDAATSAELFERALRDAAEASQAALSSLAQEEAVEASDALAASWKDTATSAELFERALRGAAEASRAALTALAQGEAIKASDALAASWKDAATSAELFEQALRDAAEASRAALTALAQEEAIEASDTLAASWKGVKTATELAADEAARFAEEMQDALEAAREALTALAQDQAIDASDTLAASWRDAATSAELFDRTLRDAAEASRAALTALAQDQAIEAHNALAGSWREIESTAARTAQTTLTNWQQAGRGIADAMGQAAADAILDFRNLADTARSLLRAILNELAQAAIARPIAQAIGSAFGLPPTPKAAGGPLAAYTPYTVGERGPELFVPDRHGFLVNASDLRKGMGTGVSVHNVFNIQSSDGPGVRAALAAAIPEIVAVAEASTARNLGRESRTRYMATGR